MATKKKAAAAARQLRLGLPPPPARAEFADLSDVELAEAVTPHWQHMTTVLPSLGEREVHRLLCWELANRRNRAIMVRLHQRWTRLRADRERKALLEKYEVP